MFDRLTLTWLTWQDRCPTLLKCGTLVNCVVFKELFAPSTSLRMTKEVEHLNAKTYLQV